MKKLFTEYWQEFDLRYIKNMYGFFEYGLWLVFEKKSGELIGRAGIEASGKRKTTRVSGENNTGGSGYFSDGL